MKRLLLVCAIALVLVISCTEDKKNSDDKVVKDLSLTVDAEYTFTYAKDYVLRKEFTKVYDINKSLVKTIVRTDTFPPSVVFVKDTLSYEKNDEERDTIISHIKEYQTYIKVTKVQ